MHLNLARATRAVEFALITYVSNVGPTVAVSHTEACFPAGSQWTVQLCCSGGGLADCFTGGFTFAGCCPSDLTGFDPSSCFGSFHEEELCCMGAGNPRCFDGRFTKRACCYSSWSRAVDPSIEALRHADHSGEAFVFGHPGTFQEQRGRFFAYLFAQLNVTGPCVEIGVKRGEFSADFLRTASALQAPLCRYIMVDVWRSLPAEEHYLDTANIRDPGQRDNLKAAIDNVADFWERVSMLQLRSHEASRVFKDEELAFVYIDARHDYCAAYDDIESYWAKVRPGGALAGDDCNAQMSMGPWGDWDVCENGTRHSGGVYQAVHDFTAERGLKWRKLHNQFIILKPALNSRSLDA